MKLLVSTLLALTCFGATAAPKIIKLKDVPRVMEVGDSYSGMLAIGRISPVAWQVELTGMTAVDPNTPTRKVKTVVDLTPVDIENPTMDETMAFSMFYDAKRAKRDNGGGDWEVVAKVVGIIYEDASVMNNTTNCLGKDLEVADPSPSTDKYCYNVVPKYIVETTP